MKTVKVSTCWMRLHGHIKSCCQERRQSWLEAYGFDHRRYFGVFCGEAALSVELASLCFYSEYLKVKLACCKGLAFQTHYNTHVISS